MRVIVAHHVQSSRPRVLFDAQLLGRVYQEAVALRFPARRLQRQKLVRLRRLGPHILEWHGFEDLFGVTVRAAEQNAATFVWIIARGVCSDLVEFREVGFNAHLKFNRRGEMPSDFCLLPYALCLMLAINLSTMADLENSDLTSRIIYSIKDAVLAHSHSPSFLEAATKHLDACGPRVFSKRGDRLVDFLNGMLGKLAKGFGCSRIHKDAIDHNLPARLRRARTSA